MGDIASVQAVWPGPIEKVAGPDEAIAVFDRALPCIHVGEPSSPVGGQPTLQGARCAFQSLEMATGLARSDSAGALVTAPVSKAQLTKVGFTHPGQTEFIAERCGVARDNIAMMLAGPSLRVVPITIHIPLAQVPQALTATLIRARAHATARGLERQFGISHPRLVMAGLNPHAGEDGLLGSEEHDVIAPTIAALRCEGLDISGPYAADAMFNAHARARYDAALCCYHDQALIPIKTLHFDDGVNITLGLPIVRTSPDHGTAFDIAGQDKADPGAMIAALRMARDAALCRRVRAEPA